MHFFWTQNKALFLDPNYTFSYLSGHSATNDISLNNDVNQKDDKTKLNCQYCPLKTAKFKDFQTHLEKKHQRKICNRCHSVFTTTSNLKVHIKVVHEGVRKQKCGTCGKPFSHASNLSKHLKTVHGLSGDELKNNFVKLSGELAKFPHLMNTSPQLNLSKEVVGSPEVLPMSDADPSMRENQIVLKSSSKFLKCPKCPWKFQYQIPLDGEKELWKIQEFDVHMKDAHPENNSLCAYCITGQSQHHPESVSYYKCGYKPFKCVVCNFSCKKKGNLNGHLKSDRHKNNVLQGLTTNSANNTSNNAGDKQQSLELYFTKCDFCEIEFKEKDSLKIHIENVHQDSVIDDDDKIRNAHFTQSEKNQSSEESLENPARGSDDEFSSSSNNSDNDLSNIIITESVSLQSTITTYHDQTVVATDSAKKKFKKKGNELKCPFCPKYYFSAIRLQIHIDLHPEADDLPEDWTPEGWTPTHKAPASEKTIRNIEKNGKGSNPTGTPTPLTRTTIVSEKTDNKRDSKINEDTNVDTATPMIKLEIKTEPLSSLQHPCNFCTETFVKVTELSDHIFQTHTKELEVVQKRDKKILADNIIKKEPLSTENREIIISKENDNFPIRSSAVLEKGHQETKIKSEPVEENDIDPTNEIHCDFSNIEQIKKQLTNKEEDRAKCNICDKAFTKKSALKEHMKKNHIEKCQSCDKRFTTQYYLKIHVKNDHTHRPCNLCDNNIQFETFSELNVHIKNVHEDKISKKRQNNVHEDLTKQSKNEETKKFISCTICNHVFDLKTYNAKVLELHMQNVHGKTNNKRLACNFCDDRFEKYSELTDHVKSDHSFLRIKKTNVDEEQNKYNLSKKVKKEPLSDENFQSDDEDEKNKEDEDFQPDENKDEKDDELQSCFFCDSVFEKSSELKVHMKTIHENVIQKELLLKESNTESRAIEGNKINNISDIVEEMDIDVDENDLNSSIIEVSNKDKSSSILGKTKFENKFSDNKISTDLKPVISDKEDEPLKPAKNQDDKEINSSIDDEEKAGNSNLNMKSNFNDSEEHHRKAHEGHKIVNTSSSIENWQKCGHCDKAFAQLNKLKKHMRQKHLEQCDSCDKKFTTPYYLKTHIKTCHDENNKKIFENSSDLNVDMKLVHQNLKKDKTNSKSKFEPFRNNSTHEEYPKLNAIVEDETNTISEKPQWSNLKKLKNLSVEVVQNKSSKKTSTNKENDEISNHKVLKNENIIPRNKTSKRDSDQLKAAKINLANENGDDEILRDPTAKKSKTLKVFKSTKYQETNKFSNIEFSQKESHSQISSSKFLFKNSTEISSKSEKKEITSELQSRPETIETICRWTFEDGEICGKTFAKPYNLKIHMQSHENLRPYECQFCGKKFRQKFHLTRHEESNHQVPEVELAEVLPEVVDPGHKCDFCKNSFHKIDDLVTHIIASHQDIDEDEEMEVPELNLAKLTEVKVSNDDQMMTVSENNDVNEQKLLDYNDQSNISGFSSTLAERVKLRNKKQLEIISKSSTENEEKKNIGLTRMDSSMKNSLVNLGAAKTDHEVPKIEKTSNNRSDLNSLKKPEKSHTSISMIIRNPNSNHKSEVNTHMTGSKEKYVKSSTTMNQESKEDLDSIRLKKSGKTHNASPKAQRKCYFCEKSFSPEKLKIHIRIRHKDQAQESNQCHLCDKFFEKKERLEKHISTIHSNELKENQKKKCHFCEKSYNNLGSLEKHIVKVHEGMLITGEVLFYLKK